MLQGVGDCACEQRDENDGWPAVGGGKAVVDWVEFLEKSIMGLPFGNQMMVNLGISLGIFQFCYVVGRLKYKRKY